MDAGKRCYPPRPTQRLLPPTPRGQFQGFQKPIRDPKDQEGRSKRSSFTNPPHTQVAPQGPADDGKRLRVCEKGLRVAFNNARSGPGMGGVGGENRPIFVNTIWAGRFVWFFGVRFLFVDWSFWGLKSCKTSYVENSTTRSSGADERRLSNRTTITANSTIQSRPTSRKSMIKEQQKFLEAD